MINLLRNGKKHLHTFTSRKSSLPAPIRSSGALFNNYIYMEVYMYVYKSRIKSLSEKEISEENMEKILNIHDYDYVNLPLE